MNSKFRTLMAGAACILGCMAAGSAKADTANAGAPPPAPAAGYVWMGGHWDSDAGQWKWVAAHWELPPSTSATWISGHWVPEGGKWSWVNGAWNVSDAQQAQSAPPQPPGSPGAMQDGSGQFVSPSPTGAAPYVDGEYGPGGVTRVVDQGEVVTDYGPVGYYPSYVGYAWDAYPWYWGAPFFAVGFGGHFGGYGHYGYYGHGGYRGARGGSYGGHGGAPAHFGGHGH
jgi:YXWGXW repeat-containing protein